MKKIVLGSLATLSLFAAEDNFVMNNSLSIWADAVFLRRSEGHEQKLFFDAGAVEDEVTDVDCTDCEEAACHSRRLISRFQYEPGFRVGMAYMTRHTIVEATYLWVAEWKSACRRKDLGQINFSEKLDNLAGDYANADKGSAHYTSQFKNAEVNYFYYVTPRRGNAFTGGWLAGARYIDFPEQMELAFVKGMDRSSYQIETENKIGALQVGGVLGWNPTRTLSWDFVAKLGMGADFCRQHTEVGNQNNTVNVRNYTRGTVSTPLVVAGALSLTYQPWEFFNLHAAYELIYLNGVATAPVQIDKSVHAPRRIKSDGYALFHGWFFGLMFGF
jgi:hypothetical protein